jgi:hypothetical protein
MRASNEIDALMRGSLGAVAVGLLIASLSACDTPKSACPSGLSGSPAKDANLLQWSGDTPTPKVSAVISKVAVECIPEGMPKTEAEGRIRGLHATYVIAATATINQRIADEKWRQNATRFSSLDDAVEFEAVTASGVVLGSGRGKFAVVGGQEFLESTVSGRIEGLTSEEASRVVSVRARWTYGRK